MQKKSTMFKRNKTKQFSTKCVKLWIIWKYPFQVGSEFTNGQIKSPSWDTKHRVQLQLWHRKSLSYVQPEARRGKPDLLFHSYLIFTCFLQRFGIYHHQRQKNGLYGSRPSTDSNNTYRIHWLKNSLRKCCHTSNASHLK